MKPERSLRRRVVAGFTLLALAASSFFAVLGFHTMEQVETRLIASRLQALAQQQLQRLALGQDVALPQGFKWYDAEHMPAALRALAPGFHDVTAGGQDVDVDVVVVSAPDGRRWALVDEESDFETIERELMLRLLLGMLAAVLLAAALGWATAGRVIAPLTALADAVRRRRLDEASPALQRGDEIGVLAQALAEHTRELDRYLRREQLFTGDVSHELRTPLTVILGAAEVLQAQCAERPAALAAVERIRRTAQDMAERVSALLLLSRTPQVLAAPRTALAPLVQRELERCRALLRGKPVQVCIRHEAGLESGHGGHGDGAGGEGPYAFAHPELAGMAIGNLLRNACQYTEQGHITVTLSPHEISVQDTGPGLPAAVRAQLFERLEHGAGDGRGGAGLGLALVKRIAEHLGWSVELQQPAGGGSRFVLRLPD